MSSVPRLKVRSVIAGRYRITRRLARGVGGTLYLVDERGSSADRVLKLLSPAAVAPKRRDRLKTALELLSHAPHPGLARVRPPHRLLEGGWYFTYDFVTGETLDRFLDRQGHRTPDVVAGLIVSFARALSHLESLGMIHGDVHPGNLICEARPRPRCVLIDPGQLEIVPLSRPAALSAGIRRDLRAFGRALFRVLAAHHFFTTPDSGRILEILRRLLGDSKAEPITSPAGLLASVGSPAADSLLIGRDDALARFDALLRSVLNSKQGRCGVIRIEGGEGMGKSRLLEAFRARTFRQGAWYADWPERIVNGRAAVRAVDDFHQLDGAALRNLESEMQRHKEIGRDERTLFVVAYRPDELSSEASDFFGRLPSRRYTRRVALPPLDRQSVGEIATQALGASVDGRLSEFLARRSEGNPAELARTLSRARRADSGWEFLPKAEPALDKALARLTPEQREAVQLASLAEVPLPDWLLTTPAGTPLAEPWLVRGDDRRVKPASIRLRNAILDRIPSEDRVRLHARLAAAIEDFRFCRGLERTRALSCHYAGAGSARVAFRYSVSAGRRLARAADHDGAAASLRRALAFAPARPRRIRAGLLRDLWRSLIASGRRAEALEVIEELVSISPTGANWLMKGNTHAALGQAEEALTCFGRAQHRPREAAEAALQAACLQTACGRHEDAAAWIGRATSTVAGSRDPKLTFKLAEAEGSHALAIFDHASACAHYRRALHLAERMGDLRCQANTHTNVAMALRRLGEAKLAAGHYRRARELHRKLNLDLESCIAGCGLALLELDAGNPVRALGTFRESVRIFGRHGDLRRKGKSVLNCGLAVFAFGDIPAARRSWSRARGMFLRLGMQGVLALTDALLARAESAMGETARAVRTLLRARALILENPNPEAEMVALMSESIIRLTLLDPHGAVRAARESAVVAGRIGDGVRKVEALHQAASALVLMGDAASARELLATGLEDLERCGNPDLKRAHRTALAECAAIEGKLNEARRRLRGVMRRGSGSFDLRLRLLRLQIWTGDVRTEAIEALHEADSQGRRGAALSLALALSEHFSRADVPRRAHYFASIVRRIWKDVSRNAPTAWRQEGERRMARLESHQSPSGGDSWSAALDGLERRAQSERSSKRLLERALDLALEHTGAERGFVVVREDGRTSPIAARRIPRADVRDAIGSPSRSFVGRVIQAERPLRIADALHDERFEGVASIREQGVRSLLCTPMRAGGETIGTLYLDDTQTPDRFDARHETDLSLLSHRLALIVEILRLKRERAGKNRRKAEPVRNRLAATTRALFPGILSQSPTMDDVFRRIAAFGPTEDAVLIVGETGVGKELVARALHSVSRRRDRILIPVDCGSMSETLLASELFGHVKGAFTGADTHHEGLFKHADGGTLFLDEVPNMSPSLQASLLRFLQEGEIRRVGDSRGTRVNVRVLAASNQPLTELIRSGKFREDLYYRLRVMEVHVPPLRDRPEDIPLLAQSFFEQAVAGSTRPAVEQDVYEVLRRHDWPGNVRELFGVVRGMAARAEGRVTGELARRVLRELCTGSARSTSPKTLNLKKARAAVERSCIQEALRRSSGNRERAARMLGVNRSSLYRLARDRGVGLS